MARPTGVTVLAVLGFLMGAGSLLVACAMFVMGAAGLATMAGGKAMGGPLAALGAFAGVLFLVFAALYIVSGRAFEIARLGALTHNYRCSS